MTEPYLFTLFQFHSQIRKLLAKYHCCYLEDKSCKIRALDSHAHPNSAGSECGGGGGVPKSSSFYAASPGSMATANATPGGGLIQQHITSNQQPTPEAVTGSKDPSRVSSASNFAVCSCGSSLKTPSPVPTPSPTNHCYTHAYANLPISQTQPARTCSKTSTTSYHQVCRLFPAPHIHKRQLNAFSIQLQFLARRVARWFSPSVTNIKYISMDEK